MSVYEIMYDILLPELCVCKTYCGCSSVKETIQNLMVQDVVCACAQFDCVCVGLDDGKILKTMKVGKKSASRVEA